MITGARQVGKSTLMQKIEEYVSSSAAVKKSERIFLVKSFFAYTLDDTELRSALKKDSYYIQKDIELSLGKPLSATTERVYIFVDEIQKYPQLLEWIKQIFDKNSSNVKFILSGSSELGLRQDTSETLAGRIEYIHVFPLNYSEILNSRLGFSNDLFLKCLNTNVNVSNGGEQSSVDAILSQLDINSTENRTSVVKFLEEELPKIYSQVKDKSREVTAILLESMFYGGLPRIYNTPLEDRIKLIKNYISVYLETEIATIARNLDLELFGLSLQSFANQNGEPLNLNQVSKEIGISRPSLYRYLDLLESTYLIKRIYPFKPSSAKEIDISKSISLYYLDTGLLNTLSYINSINEMIRPAKIDKIISSWLLLNLISELSTLDNPPKISYWQDYSGHKIDFILQRNGTVYAFLVKKPKDTRRLKATLEKFMELVDDRHVVVIYPTFNPYNQDLTYSVKVSSEIKNLVEVELPIAFI